MKYSTWREDFLAINTLLKEGRIDYAEAAEMRQYLESLMA